jgi:methyltransferase (TIGR00027 family)
MLSPAWRVLFRRAARQLDRIPASRRQHIASQIDAIPLRVAAIDAQLQSAVVSGCEQVVILGAGLDTRAFRLPSLGHAAVFEVDQPETQAYKRSRTELLRPRSRSFAFVPVDFERASLADGLSSAGFDPKARTVWIWEGVVMYLTDETVRRTLGEVSRSSAPGSVLLLHYHTPDPAPPSGEARMRKVVLSLWREPQIGLRSPKTIQDEIAGAGFRVTDDAGAAEWARRLGAKNPTGQTARVSRLLVARREAAN